MTEFPEKQIRETILDDYNRAKSLASEISNQQLKAMTENLYQRREFYKHISIVALGILGLAPFFRDKVHTVGYFNCALILLMLVIIFTLSDLREGLDKDSTVLPKEAKKYINGFDELANISIEYYSKPNLTPEVLNEYLNKIKNSRDNFTKTQIVKKDDSEFLDYFTEFILALFAIGLFLMLISVYLTNKLSVISLFLWILGIFCLIFFIPPRFFSRPLDHLINKLFKIIKGK